MKRALAHNLAQIKRQRCVLDGELVIWHKSLKSFVPFGACVASPSTRCPHAPRKGSIRTVMNSARDSYTTGAARQEEDGEEEEGGARAQLLSNEDVSEVEVWFMAFDILYDGDHSVIDRPLRERHEILRNAVNQLPEGDTVLMTAPNCLDPIGGVIKLLLPDTPWSRPVSTALEVDSMLRAAMDRNEEGLVFKDLTSAWQKGDRSNSWMKMKPDYLPTDDLVRWRLVVCVACHSCSHTLASSQDLLIIGGYMGTGIRRGGKVRVRYAGSGEAGSDATPPRLPSSPNGSWRWRSPPEAAASPTRSAASARWAPASRRLTWSTCGKGWRR